VLFHPTLAIYSRTVLADGAAGAGLLLAALAATAGAGAGVGAGLAVGLAAAMRYHAALALPVVAGSFLLDPGRARPRRDAALCLLAGAGGGGLIVAYNLAVYGAPMEPFSAARGVFSTRYFPENFRFYLLALMTVWPAMLPAPLLDRSPVRWLIRGACGLYLVFLSCYYFHDATPSWLETAVVGQRLLQVALPLWIVSYAGVLDDRVAGPLRRRLGDRAWATAAALGCAGLLAGTALAFHRHQDHLGRLREARDAVVAAVPEGSLVVANTVVSKLFAVPVGVPAYRWRALDFHGQPLDHSRELCREDRPWFLAVLPKVPGEPLPAPARELVARYRMEPSPSPDPRLSLYVARPAAGPR